MVVLTLILISIIIIGTVLGLIPIYLQNQTGSLTSVFQSITNSKAIQISSNVSLSISQSISGKKKRQITNNNCNLYQSNLIAICNGSTSLNQCNTTSLNSYLKDYTTTSVSKYN